MKHNWMKKVWFPELNTPEFDINDMPHRKHDGDPSIEGHLVWEMLFPMGIGELWSIDLHAAHLSVMAEKSVNPDLTIEELAVIFNDSPMWIEKLCDEIEIAVYGHYYSHHVWRSKIFSLAHDIEQAENIIRDTEFQVQDMKQLLAREERLFNEWFGEMPDEIMESKKAQCPSDTSDIGVIEHLFNRE